MNSFERVIAAIEMKGPDKVPVYEQTFFSNVASDILGRPVDTGGGMLQLKETEAAYQGEKAHKEFVHKMLDNCIDLFNALDFDMIRMPVRATAVPTEKIGEYTYKFTNKRSETFSIKQYDPISDGFIEIDSSVKREGIPAIERIVTAQEKDIDENNDYDVEAFWDYSYLIEAFRGKKAIAASMATISVPMESAYLEAMLLKPDLIERYLDLIVINGKKQIRLCKKLGVNVLMAGGDLADNQGPIYSPMLFKKFIFPRLKELVNYAHENGLYYFFRTDGNTWPLKESLYYESGIDGLGEIDYQAGMRLSELRKAAPHLVFWGNVDCAGVLRWGSRQQIEDAVKACIEGAYNNGGHILGSSNSILNNIPAKNYLIMREAAEKYGHY